jgi:hypothetical protein
MSPPGGCAGPRIVHGPRRRVQPHDDPADRRHRERLAPILADRWHLAVIAYAQGVMVLVGFLLLGVLGLA